MSHPNAFTAFIRLFPILAAGGWGELYDKLLGVGPPEKLPPLLEALSELQVELLLPGVLFLELVVTILV